MLILSLKERDRLAVLRQLGTGAIGVSDGARCLGVSRRHMRRLLRRYETEGDASLPHRGRGRPSNRRTAEVIRTRAIERARDPIFHDFGPTLLAEHLSRDSEIGPLCSHTLRRWLIAEGIWKARLRGTRHRRRRDRRAAAGELVLMDSSEHDWLEGRSCDELSLVAMIDDAKSHLLCRFFPTDSGAANRQVIIEYLRRYGRMGAIYADAAGHFRVNYRATARREEDLPEGKTLIRKGLEELGIELIIALSPQAKGRVERLFGTLQDRLIKEMRVAGISSMEEANSFLEEVFIPFWNSRFTVEPASAVDAHRPLPKRCDLLRVFAETSQRLIRADFTFRFNHQHYQIEKKDAAATMPGSRITVERRLDHTQRFRWQGRYLKPTRIALPPSPRSEPKPRPAPPKPKPSPNHPWKRRIFTDINPIRPLL
jgi:transposase